MGGGPVIADKGCCRSSQVKIGKSMKMNIEEIFRWNLLISIFLNINISIKINNCLF